MKKHNQNIEDALKLTDAMIMLANQGELDRKDTGCGVLYGIMLDAAYKIRKVAKCEREAHIDKGDWDNSLNR